MNLKVIWLTLTQPNETKNWKEAAGYNVGKSMNCTAFLEGNWTLSLKSVTALTFQASNATSKNFFYVQGFSLQHCF